VQFSDYQKHVSALKYGKRLPSVVYVFRETDSDFGKELNRLVTILVTQHQIGPEFNLVKFRTDEFKVSFLSYPDFMEDAHPALRHAITLDLVTGRARHTDYAGNLNPPILHRKETFLPVPHPARSDFETLTRLEEVEGLYEQTATIGFKLNWEKLLGEKGLKILGHELIRGRKQMTVEATAEPVVDRHKTAMTRYDLSKPVKSLLEYGMLKSGDVFLDYGCGQGSDVRGLQGVGHTAEGWDPVHQPKAKKREADVVNMGYVLNVIIESSVQLTIV
jgi:hypothetical protein